MFLQQGIVLLCAIIHFSLAYIQCNLLTTSKTIQKLYLKQYFESEEALNTIILLMFNYGSYNFLIGLLTIIGQFIESYYLIQATLIIYSLNIISLLWNKTNFSRFITLLQSIPAIIGLLLPSSVEIEHEKPTDNLPIYAILIPAIFHILFFVAESILFSKVSSVRKVFLGKLSKSKEATEIATEYFFEQGIYNLKLALITLYGLFVTKNVSTVIGMLFAYAGAAFVLIYSSSRMWKGFIIQGLPAIFALYLLRDHIDVIYYNLLRGIYSEDDEDH